jgi:hypothetical protein
MGGVTDLIVNITKILKEVFQDQTFKQTVL